MKSRTRFVFISFFLVLVLATLACSTVKGTPTDTSPATDAVTEKPTEKPTEAVTEKPTEKPTEATGGEVTIVQSYGYQDSWDYYHVVGILRNDSSEPVSGLELDVEIRDASGKSLLMDGDASVEFLTAYPSFYTLQPGEEAPFDFYTSIESGEPSDYVVTITEGYEGDSEDRPSLSVENTQLITDGDGSYYLTGELVNDHNEGVYIASLVGALFADDGTMVATSSSYDKAYSLMPAGDERGMDRTPFSISMDAPEDGDFTDWQVYIESSEDDDVVVAPISIAFTNNYLDEWDSFHLVGTLTNETEDNVVYSTSLITGLYDGNGVVLDARTSSVPMYILPGETVPFEISYFYILEEGDNMDRFETFTVQIDPYWTYEVDYDLVDLAVTNEDATYDSSGMWTIKGEVTNNSGSDLTSATVVAGLFDAEDTLVAMNWTYIWPDGEVIADGETYDFEIYIYADPSLDPANLFYDFIVQGVLD